MYKKPITAWNDTKSDTLHTTYIIAENHMVCVYYLIRAVFALYQRIYQIKHLVTNAKVKGISCNVDLVSCSFTTALTHLFNQTYCRVRFPKLLNQCVLQHVYFNHIFENHKITCCPIVNMPLYSFTEAYYSICSYRHFFCFWFLTDQQLFFSHLLQPFSFGGRPQSHGETNKTSLCVWVGWWGVNEKPYPRDTSTLSENHTCIEESANVLHLDSLRSRLFKFFPSKSPPPTANTQCCSNNGLRTKNKFTQ